MYKKLVTLAIISAFALSACGGGSDDDGTNQPNPQPAPTPQPDPTPNTNPTPDPDQTPAPDPDPDPDPDPTPLETPFTMKLQTGSAEYAADRLLPKKDSIVTTNDGISYQTININGQKFSIPANTSDEEKLGGSKYVTDTNGKEYQIVVAPEYYSGAYARYGWVYEAGIGKTNYHFYYQGLPTEIADMPTTGTAKYTGLASGAYEYGYLEGDVELTADFANKTLKGEFKDWRKYNGEYVGYIPKVEVEAKIQANTFQGKANMNGYVEGKFYGPKAENLAGAFEDKSQSGIYHGVFGGVKR